VGNARVSRAGPAAPTVAEEAWFLQKALSVSKVTVTPPGKLIRSVPCVRRGRGVGDGPSSTSQPANRGD
jgi:hypothetical protein